MSAEKGINYCKSNAVFSIILFFVSFKLASSNASNFSAVPWNLTASVFEDTTYVKNHDEYGPIKLNITWKAPLDGRKISSYSVLITSLKKDNETSDNFCLEETLFYTTRDGDHCHAILPENQFLSDAPELSIRPTCSYAIQVFANPRSNPKLQGPEIILIVPDCVGRWCGCEKAEEYLPIPEVDIVTQSSDSIEIKWKNALDPRINSYVISFGVPFLISNNQLPVYNISKIANVSATVSSFVWSANSSDLNVKSGGKIYVAAEDNFGCLGTAGFILMDLPVQPLNSIQRPSHFQWLLWISLVGMLVTILGIVASFLYNRNRKKYELIWGNQATSRIQSLIGLSRLRSHWADSTLRERNILYVEQEIQYAINRGEADEFEVSCKRLKFIRELGKGQFGKVYLGTFDGPSGRTVVAIKMSNCSEPSSEPQARQQLLAEIETMKNAGPHPHLVRLIATCTLPEKPICVILEYLEGGDLLAHLHRLRDSLSCDGTVDSGVSSSRSQRPSLTETEYTTLDQSPTIEKCPVYPTENHINSGKEYVQTYVNITEDDSTTDTTFGCHDLDAERFTSFALDIARGMEHLEAKGIIHRDLAARNILLSSDMTLKISDFGLSRNDGVYIIGNGDGGVRRLPVRWMAPEALRDRAFTSKSDVWSFAIVLWEIGTFGAFPYSDIQDDQLLRHVLRDEGRLERPENVTSELYDIMRSCWSSRPENRPSFAQLVHRLLALDEPTQFFRATSNPCYSFLPTLSIVDNAINR